MSPHTRFLLALSVALGTAAACSSASSMPPELGNCVKVGDASCSPPVTGGGSASGPGGSDSGTSETGVESEGGTCGAAPTMLGTSNTQCVPCIEGSGGCCQAAADCTGNCLTLLSCMLDCGTGNTTCQNNCEQGATSSVIGAYIDFAACVGSTCAGCPTLPTGGTADF